MWLGYRGVLRKTGRFDQGVRTYVVDDPNTSIPLVEFTPSRGMDLDVLLGRTAAVWGYTWYRGDLRHNFMQASQLFPSP